MSQRRSQSTVLPFLMGEMLISITDGAQRTAQHSCVPACSHSVRAVWISSKVCLGLQVTDGGTDMNDGCSGRARAMPHIKTFARYCSDSDGRQPTELAWVVVSSHNFGPSPWGELQKAQTQLMIRSYELGILVTPETELAAQVAMGAEDVSLVRLLQGVAVPPASAGQGAAQRCAGEVRSSTSPLKVDAGSHLTCCDFQPQAVSWIPLPYELPPAPYRPQDIPWAVDDAQHRPDCLGNSYVPGQPLMLHGPQVHDRGATGHGHTAQGGSRVSSLHDQQYRQQQLQRQRQQTLQQQQGVQGIVIPSHAGQRSTHSSQDGGVSDAASIGSGTPLAGTGSSAQWCWKAGAGWQPYDSRTTAALEQAHSQFFVCKHNGTNPGPFVKVDVGGGRHVNLAAMLQVVTATPGRTRHVRRTGPPPRAYARGDGAGGTAVHLRDTWA